MDAIMGFSCLVMLLGFIVMLVGMFWGMLDGRLWNNPGEAVMMWGLGICLVAFIIMLVALFIFGVQCSITTTCQL